MLCPSWKWLQVESHIPCILPLLPLSPTALTLPALYSHLHTLHLQRLQLLTQFSSKVLPSRSYLDQLYQLNPGTGS